MGRRRLAQPMVTTSVKISPEFHRLCYQHNLSFSEAMKIGISLMLAEREVIPYDNNLNLMRRMILVQKKLEETSQELFDLKKKYEKNDNTTE
jgi:hypothetical protein